MAATTLRKRDWEKTARQLTAITASLRASIPRGVHSFAEIVRDRIKTGILTQSFRLKPLTKRYLKWKIRHGYDQRILIRTGHYVQSIIVRDTARGSAVDVDPKARTFNGQPMWKLAHWLEYGTKRMDPRPHWRPTIPWAQSAWPRFMKGVITNNVRGAR